MSAAGATASGFLTLNSGLFSGVLNPGKRRARLRLRDYPVAFGYRNCFPANRAVGRLARASAPLLMQIQSKISIDGSREPLSTVSGRPIHVINAVLRIRAVSYSFKSVAATLVRSTYLPASKRLLKPNKGDRWGSRNHALPDTLRSCEGIDAGH